MPAWSIGLQDLASSRASRGDATGFALPITTVPPLTIGRKARRRENHHGQLGLQPGLGIAVLRPIAHDLRVSRRQSRGIDAGPAGLNPRGQRAQRSGRTRDGQSAPRSPAPLSKARGSAAPGREPSTCQIATSRPMMMIGGSTRAATSRRRLAIASRHAGVAGARGIASTVSLVSWLSPGQADLMYLTLRLSRYFFGLAGSNAFPSKNFSTPREVDFGMSWSATPSSLAAARQRSSRFTFAISDLVSGLAAGSPSACSRSGTRGRGTDTDSSRCPSSSASGTRCLHDAAGAVIEVALQAVDDVFDRGTDPAAARQISATSAAFFGPRNTSALP